MILNCKFCFTGTQKLVRNLTSGEIISQLLLAKDNLSDWPNGKDRKISNIVFMGMGEPLYNYENVIESIKLITSEDGIKFQNKKDRRRKRRNAVTTDEHRMRSLPGKKQI